MTRHIRYKLLSRAQRNRQLFDRGLICMTVTYITIFIVATLILSGTFQIFQKDEPPAQIESTIPLYLYMALSPSDRLHFDALSWPQKNINGVFNCTALNEVKYSLVASGWTKSIFKFNLSGKSYALKMMNPNGEGMTRCLSHDNFQNCHAQASAKLIKEYILSQELRHANIINVLGWCILDFNFVMVSELCQPLSTLSFLTMNFTERFKISLHATRLLSHLARSPIGSVGLTDFRREQFVLCNDRLKLTDLDDISIDEPNCDENLNCQFGTCKNKVCEGYNHMKNVQFVVQDMVNLTLAYDTPISVRPLLSKFLIKNVANDSIQLLKLLENVCTKLKKINHRCL